MGGPLVEALVVLPYFERPVMVRNALESLRRNMDAEWRCVFIDDGSVARGEPIVREAFPDLVDRMEFVRCDDTVQDKIWQGGSRHPHYMNEAIARSRADVVIILCDDDALVEGSVKCLLDWYTAHPEAKWSYGKVSVFDPSKEPVPWGERRMNWFLNDAEGDIRPAWRVDSCQVSFRREWMPKYPEVNTVNNDATMFEGFQRKHGLCPPNGLVVSYKGSFGDQLGRRPETDYYKVGVA